MDDDKRDARDAQYVGFEDRFRGSEQEIREKLRGYVPLFAGARSRDGGRGDVLDIGCGRGEFLALLQAAGIGARGVDANREMVRSARARGLDVSCSDALAHLESLPDRSLGGVMAAQMVEHVKPAYLIDLLATAFHKLQPEAPIVIETINPACWLAFFSGYLRDFTHVQPVHPETLQFLLQANGFARVTIQYSAPVSDAIRMRGVTVPPGPAADAGSRLLLEVARAVNENATVLNSLLFSFQDYAVIGYRS